MPNRKILHNIDYQTVMYPDDKKTIAWLNGLKVPYKTNMDFVKNIALHPFDHSLKEWYAILKAGTDYYTFRDFLNATVSRFREAYNEVENQGEGINITSNSLPTMYEQLVDACNILSIKDIPAYSTDWQYGPYHYSVGEKRRRIIMMSGSADLFTEDEMMFVLGHELGHFACGHKPYHMLVETFYMPFLNDPAFKAWASVIRLPLFKWFRTSDYTADRVGLLCCQDINVALTTMIKKAGLPKKCYDNIDIEGFLEQGRNFKEDYTGIWDRLIKELSIRSAQFPWLVVRGTKLKEWYDSGEYQRIINNN